MTIGIAIRSKRFRLLQLALFLSAAISVASLRSAPEGPPSPAVVTAVKGSAYGYRVDISLFGGPANTRGPTPSVTLPPSGGSVSANAATSSAQVGPAIFFSSGPVAVSSQGTTGPGGSVMSSANIQNLNTSQQEVFTAQNVSSTCSASETGVSGSATITGGTLQIDNGNDINGDGNFTGPGEHGPVNVNVPTNPAPNAAPISGHLHVGSSVDNFEYRFNEQVINPDGSLTVYAAHQRFFGPTAVGDLYIGKVECGVTPTATPTPTPSRLGNISTRLRVETGDNVLIGGFIVTGTQPKKVILRAIGPSLPLAGKLENPTLELFGPGGPITSNDNWRSSQEAEIIASTVPPSNDLESAIVATLPANGAGYTAIVRGAGGGTGIGLVEVYDLDRTVDSKLANISSRGLVQTADNVMIGGFIVSGSNTKKVIVRAIGPSLPVPGKLADPTLELFNSNGVPIAMNDNWRSGGQEAEIIASTVPPTNDLESAIVATLPPGGSTAIVRGVNNTTGVALVEVYSLD